MSPPFVFPPTHSTVLPNPSTFFSPSLLSSPLPTNSFFQNFLINNGSTHEYFHPYLVKPTNVSLSLSYPAFFFSSALIYQLFLPDLTISSKTTPSSSPHVVTSFSDLGVTLDIPSSNLRFFLVKGSPFVTASVLKPTSISISTVHSILAFSSGDSLTKHTLRLDNNQTWILYTSSPVKFRRGGAQSEIRSDSGFSGVVRIAALPDSSSGNPMYEEEMLDRYRNCYPVSGDADLKDPFRVVYKFQKKRSGDLLMLAHPLHLKLLSANHNRDVTVLEDFKYRSIDGELVGVVGDSWVLQANPIPVSWTSKNRIKQDSYKEIASALSKDVNDLNSSAIGTTSSYFYGKRIARAARLALIAEEVSFPDVVPKVTNFLKEAIEPWLYGTFQGNGFLYEQSWKGLVTQQGSTSSTADFGFGIYNDHHFHLGYFIYAIAVLAKIDPNWGQKHKPQAYSLVQDFMNLGTTKNPNYPRVRCFDFYKLHSWAAGLTEFVDGRNQESTSEAVNAYYSAALMGLAYGDSSLVSTGSTLAAMEILAAQTWWHVEEEEGKKIYEESFVKENRIVGVLWNNKRDSALWWASAECRECRLLIQVLPLLPITETLFSDVGYVKELVEWTVGSGEKEKDVEDGYKGFIYAMEGVYDRESALKKIRKLEGFDDGNSMSNLLCWQVTYYLLACPEAMVWNSFPIKTRPLPVSTGISFSFSEEEEEAPLKG
ncbi:putative endo-1,3(4)-beta-glucanase [Senna tora]|uniref:glucan endo-1,3-beta-D-glucosidase n=1 Tax=Senna tora TaxID=362788 RepID=A0A834SX61_9FABA|nr:putative endo-1,3(4)-beta-glucanase [Senna tora]